MKLNTSMCIITDVIVWYIHTVYLWLHFHFAWRQSMNMCMFVCAHIVSWRVLKCKLVQDYLHSWMLQGLSNTSLPKHVEVAWRRSVWTATAMLSLWILLTIVFSLRLASSRDVYTCTWHSWQHYWAQSGSLHLYVYVFVIGVSCMHTHHRGQSGSSLQSKAIHVLSYKMWERECTVRIKNEAISAIVLLEFWKLYFHYLQFWSVLSFYTDMCSLMVLRWRSWGGSRGRIVGGGWDVGTWEGVSKGGREGERVGTCVFCLAYSAT